MQEFMFAPVGDGTYSVSGYKGDEKDVVIPDSYGSGVITVIGDKLFSGHKEIESVHIPDTVTNMGEFIFDGCENLRRIDLPSQLECLWGYTFVRCGIEEITLPDKLNALILDQFQSGYYVAGEKVGKAWNAGKELMKAAQSK